MKIVIACEIFEPDMGGPATFVKKLTPILKQRGDEVSFITYADQKSKDGEVVKVDRRCHVFFRYWKYFWALKKLAKDSDLIFAQGPIAAGLPAILLKKITGKKVYIKVVGDVAWERSRNKGQVFDLIDDFQNKKYSFSVELNKKIRSWTVKNADLVITPSQYLKKIVTGWGAQKVKVIYNSFSQKRSPLSQEQAKKQIGVAGDIILSVGRLAPWKGFEVLIDLMPVLLMVNNQFKLVIAGSGPEENNLKSKIRNLQLDEKVILAGSVKQEEMANYYQAADLFILNSAYEGLSHALLEALSYGLPTIASGAGGNTEVITDNRNGLLISYNNQQQILDAVKKLSGDNGLAEQFKEASKEVFEKFSIEKMNEEYLRVLNIE